MQVIRTRAEWQKIWLQAIKSNNSLGLVPTMGALHQGHLDLIHASKNKTDLTVVSIFVNPTQFNNPYDFTNYPKTIESDLLKLQSEEVDYVFLPEMEEIYPEHAQLTLDFGRLQRVLEGAFRPGHFNGVGIVVSKLLNIIRSTDVFFGQKDLQQVAIIRRLIIDFSFNLTLHLVPTRRESDGLAMSSRNLRLSHGEREQSLILIQSLQKAKEELISGSNWLDVQNQITREFENTPLAKLEYFELVHPESFEVFGDFDPNQKSSICVAAYIGEVRLIDNLSIIS